MNMEEFRVEENLRLAEGEKPYALSERTALFGEQVVAFARKVPGDAVTDRLIRQLIGAGTSVGANWCEADEAVSGKDFKHRCSICKKEARETGFFVRMIVKAVPELREEAVAVWQEAKELHLIFAKLHRG